MIKCVWLDDEGFCTHPKIKSIEPARLRGCMVVLTGGDCLHQHPKPVPVLNCEENKDE